LVRRGRGEGVVNPDRGPQLREEFDRVTA
jgi:hypothetical protein